ncbi:MAG: acetyl-CoA synthetase [Clostridiales bacterium]|nr:acetyl-CoA synthetase [Clostridiales bacterium]
MVGKYINRFSYKDYEDFKENYRIIVPENFNFGYDIVDEWAMKEPNKKALLWCNDDGQEKLFTFGDIKRLSDKAANAFLKHGIKRGDVVLQMLMQRPEAWINMVALHKIGAVVIPATYQLTEKDIVYRCNSADIKMVVCVEHAELVENVKSAMAKCPTVHTLAMVNDVVRDGFVDWKKEIELASDKFEKMPTNNNDPMLIYFSSGTTGMPKMVMHDFTYPLGHITTAKFWNQVEENRYHLTQSDSGWAKFAWGKIYGQWIVGATIVAYDTEKFNAVKMLELISRIKLTTFCAPPTIYRFLLKEDMSKYDISSIKHFSTAGEPLNPEVQDKLFALTGKKINEGFGQSESTVLVGYFGDFTPIKPGSMGKPAPIYDIDIVDENGNTCEDGVVGSLVVRNTDVKRPVGLFREYFKDDAANAKSFRNNMYDTGDTAWRDCDGYLWFVGRSDDVIKCSGYRIGPFEVESALYTHPAVLECAITAVPDEIRGQVVKATIVLAKGYLPSDNLVKELQNHVKVNTAPYKYPRVVEFVKELPKTSSGKVKRVAIRAADMQKNNK